jgi:hypothetical protein
LEKAADPVLVLEQWEALSGGKTALSGESVPWTRGARLKVYLSGGGGPMTLTVLRNGETWKTVKGPAPLRWESALPSPPPGGDFYRLLVRAPTGTLVSNPLFLKP